MAGLAITISAALIGVGCTASGPPATFPSKPITIVVPSGPGAGQDVTARQLADRMAKIAGQTVTVVNKPGAGNAVGFAYTLEQPHDGHTIMTGNRSLTLTPYTAGADIDNTKLRGVSKVVTDWYVLVVNASSPWQTLEEFVSAAKSGPTSMKFGGPNVGSTTHITTIEFARKAGFQAEWIPSPSGAEAMVAVLGGQVPAFFGELGETYGNYEAKKLRYLAIASPERLASLPDVPTMKEKGIDLVADNWRGLLAPADAPDAAVTKLDAMVKQVVDDPSFVSEVETSRSSVAYLGSAEFSKEFQRLNEEGKQIAIELGLFKQ